MSDDDSQYSNAWEGVFDPAEKQLPQLLSKHSCPAVKSIEEFYEATKWKLTFMEVIMWDHPDQKVTMINEKF